MFKKKKKDKDKKQKNKEKGKEKEKETGEEEKGKEEEQKGKEEEQKGKENEIEKEEELTVDDFELLSVIGGANPKNVQVRRKYAKKGEGNREEKEEEEEEDKTVYKLRVERKQNCVHPQRKKEILQKLVHPFLVNLHYYLQTEDKIYYIMDNCTGGEMFDYLRQYERFSEDGARFFCAEVVCALEYLHDNGVVHRDLKPENILFTEEGHIRLSEFGDHLLDEKGLTLEEHTFCGTPEYLAPEILIGGNFGKEVDWWSFGTLLYEMLTGLPPFYSENINEMYDKIINATAVYPEEMGKEAKDLIEKLLIRDPKKRLCDVNVIKDHPFFDKIDWDKLVAREITPAYFVDPQQEFEQLNYIGDDHFDGFTFVPELTK